MNLAVSVLIVSYNSENYLNACIDSVLNSETSFSIEVIVVDNNSSDNSVEVLKAYGEKIIFIVNNYNYGFAKAMNQAALKASGNYILTFNPDAELNKDAIEESVRYLKKNKQVGLLAPVITNANGKSHYPNYNLPAFDQSSALRFFSEKLFPRQAISGPKEVNFVFGTGLIADRLLLKNGMLYPEDTFLFWEEYYLAKQAHELNRKIIIYPSYKISHHRSVSFKFDKEKIAWMQKLILPYGYHVRIAEHGRLLATLNYLFKSLDNLLLWLILEAGTIIGINKKSLKITSQINIVLYLQSIFMTKLQSLEFHKKAKIYFNKGKHHPAGNII